MLAIARMLGYPTRVEWHAVRNSLDREEGRRPDHIIHPLAHFGHTLWAIIKVAMVLCTTAEVVEKNEWQDSY